MNAPVRTQNRVWRAGVCASRLFRSNTLVCNWLPVVAVTPAVGMFVVMEDRKRSR